MKICFIEVLTPTLMYLRAPLLSERNSKSCRACWKERNVREKLPSALKQFRRLLRCKHFGILWTLLHILCIRASITILKNCLRAKNSSFLSCSFLFKLSVYRKGLNLRLHLKIHGHLVNLQVPHSIIIMRCSEERRARGRRCT